MLLLLLLMFGDLFVVAVAADVAAVDVVVILDNGSTAA